MVSGVRVIATTSCPSGRCSSSETTALPKWPLAPLTPIFMSPPIPSRRPGWSDESAEFQVLRSIFGPDREIHPGPRRELGRFMPSYPVRERNLLVGFRTEIRVSLEIAEHLGHLGGPREAGREDVLGHLC